MIPKRPIIGYTMNNKRVGKRPSTREIDSKLNEAREILSKGDGYFANVNNIVGEIAELELSKPSEIWPLLRKALEEIEAASYSGSYPPQEAYEEIVKGQDCWQFTWESESFGKRMFLRFMLMRGKYFHSSLHESY